MLEGSINLETRPKTKYSFQTGCITLLYYSRPVHRFIWCLRLEVKALNSGREFL